MQRCQGNDLKKHIDLHCLLSQCQKNLAMPLSYEVKHNSQETTPSTSCCPNQTFSSTSATLWRMVTATFSNGIHTEKALVVRGINGCNGGTVRYMNMLTVPCIYAYKATDPAERRRERRRRSTSRRSPGSAAGAGSNGKLSRRRRRSTGSASGAGSTGNAAGSAAGAGSTGSAGGAAAARSI